MHENKYNNNNHNKEVKKNQMKMQQTKDFLASREQEMINQLKIIN